MDSMVARSMPFCNILDSAFVQQVLEELRLHLVILFCHELHILKDVQPAPGVVGDVFLRAGKITQIQVEDADFSGEGFVFLASEEERLKAVLRILEVEEVEVEDRDEEDACNQIMLHICLHVHLFY